MHLFLSSEQHYSASYYFNQVHKPITETLERKIEKGNYGTEFDSIGIITIIASKEMIDDGFCAERKYVSRKNKFADIRLQIDLERFLSENEYKQRLLCIKNIVDSIRVVGLKAKGDFNAKQLEQDILNVLSVKAEEIDCL